MKEEQGRKSSAKTVIPFYQNGDYFFHRGLNAFHNKHLNRAAKLFERAVKLTASEPVFKIQLAAVLTELGEYTRSNELLQQVLEVHQEKQPVCYFFIANNEVYLGRFYQAEKHVRLYMEKDPQGQFMVEAEELLELFEDEALFDDDKEHAEQLLTEHEQAWTWLRNGDLEAAVPLLESIIKNQPTGWAARTHLAEAMFRLGKEQEAFNQCNYVLEQDGGNMLALCNLALFYQAKGYTKQVDSYRAQLSKIIPMNSDHMIRVTEVLCVLGAYEDVVARQWLSIQTDDKDILRCFGVAYFQQGEKQKGLSYLKQASKLNDPMADSLIHLVDQGKSDQIKFTLFTAEVDMSRTVDKSSDCPLR